MSKMYLDEYSIKLKQRAKSWKEAIKIAGSILEKNEVATNDYTEAMIDIVEEYGPYIVVFDGVALAHAKSESGVLKTGASLVTLEDPIEFGNEDNDPVEIVIAIAGNDPNDHLYLLQKMTEVFSHEGVEKILEAKDEKEVLKLFTGDDD